MSHISLGIYDKSRQTHSCE